MQHSLNHALRNHARIHSGQKDPPKQILGNALCCIVLLEIHNAIGVLKALRRVPENNLFKFFVASVFITFIYGNFSET